MQHVHVCMQIWMWQRMDDVYVCVCVHIYVHVYMHVYLCVYVNVYVYVYACVYRYIISVNQRTNKYV